MMSPIRRRWAGLIAALGLAGPIQARAQGLPDPLPPLPPSSGPTVAPAEMVPPEVRPTPTVIPVPPGGMRPTWAPGVDDPAVTATHDPKFVAAKSRSRLWRRLQGKLLGYPEEFTPRPLGASLYDHGRMMVANGAAARLTLYRYDFIDGSAELSPRGLDQLAKLAPQLVASPYPLIVERTPDDPSLASSRRYAVLATLARGACPVTSDRVLVGVPIANGLSGSDAQVIAGNALGRTQAYGPPIPLNSNGVNSPSGVTINSGAVAP